MKNAKGLGGKKRGRHGTFTPAASDVCSQLVKSPIVTGISAGVIKTGLKAAHGKKSIKVIKNPRGALILSIRDNISVMEVRVSGSDYDAIIQLLREIASDLHMDFNFEDRSGA